MAWVLDEQVSAHNAPTDYVGMLGPTVIMTRPIKSSGRLCGLVQINTPSVYTEHDNSIYGWGKYNDTVPRQMFRIN